MLCSDRRGARASGIAPGAVGQRCGSAAVFGLGMTLALRSFDLFVRYEGTAGNGATMQGGTGGLRFLF